MQTPGESFLSIAEALETAMETDCPQHAKALMNYAHTIATLAGHYARRREAPARFEAAARATHFTQPEAMQ